MMGYSESSFVINKTRLHSPGVSTASTGSRTDNFHSFILYLYSPLALSIARLDRSPRMHMQL